MDRFVSATRTKVAGWVTATVIVTLNLVLLGQLAFGS
jgi:manganese transport protein